MIDKLKNSPLNLQATSVYNFNEFSLTELLNKFFSTINDCVDSSNTSLQFLSWLKSEGLPSETLKELNNMYNDGRLTNAIDNLSGNLNNKIVETKEEIKENINNEITKVNTQLEQKAKVSINSINVFRKLIRGENVKIICQGDSLTYGQDTVSADKRPADTNLTDNGVTHTFTRASITYPEKLQENLRQIYGNNVTVINKGYSGDYAKLSYEHWNKNDNADMCLLMLGTNDSSASYIPSEFRGNVTEYFNYMKKIISRYLSWGTTVVLLTPPKQKLPEDLVWEIESFRQACKRLSLETGCQLIDTQEFFNGCNTTFFSDVVHLNAKGYSLLANLITSYFIGYGEEKYVNSNSTFSFRKTRDNCVLKNCTLTEDPNSVGFEENSVDKRYMLLINEVSECYFSFTTTEDNLILIPIISGDCKIDLDFNIEQRNSPNLAMMYDSKNNEKPPNSVTISNSILLGNILDGSYKTKGCLHIPNKGIHNIKITKPTSGTSYLNGFILMDFNKFNEDVAVIVNTSVPTVGGITTLGTSSLTSSVCNYVKDLKTKVVTLDLYIKGTISNDVEGTFIINTNILELFKPKNNVNYFIGRCKGLIQSEPIYAYANATEKRIFFVKYVNGVQTLITANELRGKEIEISLSCNYISY